MLPVVSLAGSPFDQGRTHGLELKGAIHDNLALYFGRFREEFDLAAEEVLARSESYAFALERSHPDYYEAMRGVAEGANIGLEEVTALNIRYELFYYGYGLADGCTSFALAPKRTETGRLVIGQNWDWIPEVKGALLHTTHQDGLQTLSFTEAGIVGGKIGLSSVGLGLAINGLTSTADDWQGSGAPFHVRCYDILRQHTLEDAVAVVTEGPRACSANFVIAQAPDTFVDLEAAPHALHQPEICDGLTVHANHFVDPEIAGVTEPPNDEHRPQSYARHARLEALLSDQSTFNLEEVKARLRDHQGHPNSLCRHPDMSEPEQERYATVTSIIMDLDTLTLYASDGPPCESDYQVHQLEA